MKSTFPDRLARISTCALILVILSACGKERGSLPTATIQPTPIIQTTQPASAIQTAQPLASPVSIQGTVGAIADRIASAWTGVKTYRVTSTTWTAIPGSPVAIASPVAALPNAVLVDEFILPDRHHRIQTEQGQTSYELVVVDGVIYARGPAVPGITPIASADDWIRIDPSAIQTDPFASYYAGLLQPVSVPYSGLSKDERERIAHPLGATDVNGRRCQQFRVADTTNTGERIDILIGIGDDNLLCSIETRVATTTNITTFEFNVPLTIEAPL